MRSRSFAVAALLVAVLCFGAPFADAAKFEITLDSGTTFYLEKVADDRIDVEDGSADLVGYLIMPGSGGNVDVFDPEGKLLGSAEVINPDALEILDGQGAT